LFVVLFNRLAVKGRAISEFPTFSEGNSVTAKHFILPWAILFFAPTFAQAQSNSSTLKMDDLKKPDEKTKDIDNEITDPRMRAALGSKSRYSFKSSFVYQGGSVEEPLSSVRPNYEASAKMQDMASIRGEIGLNARVGDRDSITLGTGIKIVDPLHGDLTKPATDTRKKNETTQSRYQVATPSISWNRGYRAFDAQMMTFLSYRHATEEDAVNLMKAFGTVVFGHSVLGNFAAPRWTGGATFIFGHVFYSGEVTDPFLSSMIASGRVKRPEYFSAVIPSLQYSMTSRYSLRSEVFLNFARYTGYDETVQIEPSQSLGLGISVTRDIFLYPNVQFTPKDIRSDRTNVAVSANINLF
jgi:hypothetical protein